MRITIEVCLSPDLLHILDLEGKIAVVVDVLRATSCMAAGLGHGVEHIIPFDNVEECQAMKSEGYLTAGERNGDLIPGMDMGNSPFEYMRAGKSGARVAATTTNGTRSIHLSAKASYIITASFINFSAAFEYIRKRNLPVVVVCAGWKGKVNLEDSLLAGALVDRLQSTHDAIDDACHITQKAYLSYADDLFSAIKNSEHAKRLARFNIVKDIEFCSRLDEVHVVPEMQDGRLRPASF